MKKRPFLLSILLLVPVVAMCAPRDRAKQLFDEAIQSLNAANYTQAEIRFHQLLALDPHNVSALANLGILYARTHRYMEAVVVDKEAVSEAPQRRELVLNLGLAYLKQDDYAHALPFFEQLHDRDASDLQATKLLATCLAFAGQAEKAIALLVPLVQGLIQDPSALYLLGITYSRAGREQQAEAVFTKLFSDSATPAQANFLLGKAYAEATNYTKAIEAFQAALAAEPHFPGAQRELGKAYLGGNEIAPAEDHLRVAVQDDSQDGSANYYLGALIVQNGRFQEGLYFLERARNLLPDSWATYFYL